MMQAHLLNGVALAYLGDVYYELGIRKYLLNAGMTKVNDLHKKAILYTSGTAQANIIKTLLEEALLSEDEISYFKKGRNASGPGRKNIDMTLYHHSTGFESMMGYLYLTNEPRANEIIEMAIEIINKRGE